MGGLNLMPFHLAWSHQIIDPESVPSLPAFAMMQTWEYFSFSYTSKDPLWKEKNALNLPPVVF